MTKVIFDKRRYSYCMLPVDFENKIYFAIFVIFCIILLHLQPPLKYSCSIMFNRLYPQLYCTEKEKGIEVIDENLFF